MSSLMKRLAEDSATGRHHSWSKIWSGLRRQWLWIQLTWEHEKECPTEPALQPWDGSLQRTEGSCVNSQHRRRSVQKAAMQKRGPRTIRKRPKGHLASSPPPDVDEQTEFRNMPSKQTLLLTQLNGSGIQLQAKAAKKPHVQCKAKTGWKEEDWERHAVPPLMQNAVAFINVR